MKIGFIGCGNMGSAMIGGILRQGIFSKEDIIVSNLTPEGKATTALLKNTPLSALPQAKPLHGWKKRPVFL